jgi:hypothetical protein
MTALDQLCVALLPPKNPYRAEGDWVAVETALGLRLPSDYKAFITAYGSGVINGCLDVENPFNVRDDIRAWWTNFAAFYHDLPKYGQEIPYPVFPAKEGLLPFGTLGDVNLLNWLTIGDPDRWPFVYYDATKGFFEVKGLSATEFLLEAVTQRSPLLIRLRSDSVFAPPCDFEPYVADRRVFQFLHPRSVNLDSLAAQLAGRWTADQVRIRRTSERVRLIIEALKGTVEASHEGSESTWVWVRYDQSCVREAEEVAGELLRSGFLRPGHDT